MHSYLLGDYTKVCGNRYGFYLTFSSQHTYRFSYNILVSTAGPVWWEKKCVGNVYNK